MGLFSKTTEPNELKFRVELDFSHTVAQKKVSGHSDKVAIIVIHVTCTGSFDVHSTVPFEGEILVRVVRLSSCRLFINDLENIGLHTD